MRTATLFAALLILASACSSGEPKEPDDLIPESLYLDLLAELWLSRQLVEQQGLHEVEDSLQQLIFDHYEITVERFDRTHEYYQRDPSAQIVRIDSLRERLNREQDDLYRFRIEPP